MKKIEINDGHYLELMDRLSIFACNLEDHIYNHPLTSEIKQVQKLIDKAGNALADAYQLVGEESYKKNVKNETNQEVVSRRRKKSKK